MRIALVISALLNLVLAAGVFGLWTVGPRAVTQMEDVAEREQRLAIEALTPISQGDIVFAGDDLLARGPWGDVFRHYTVFLRNRAIRGETCPRLRERLDQWLKASRARNSDVGVGRVLVLGCGAADVIHGVEERRSLHAISAMLDMVASQSPATRVIVLGTVPEEEMVIEDLHRHNSAVKEIAMARSIPFLDFALLIDQEKGGLKSAFATPSGRLNGEGYRLIAETLAPYLRP